MAGAGITLEPIWALGAAGYAWLGLSALALGASAGLLGRSRLRLALKTGLFLSMIEKLLLAGNADRAYKLASAHDGPVASLTRDALREPDGPPKQLTPEGVRERAERSLNERLAPALWGLWPARVLCAAGLASGALVAARVERAGYPALGLGLALLAAALYATWAEEQRWVRDLNRVVRRLTEIAAKAGAPR